MKRSIIVLLLLIRLVPAHAEAGIQFFTGTFPEAIAEAKKQHKLVFIDCFTTWCGPCKWMAAHVFTDTSVSNPFNRDFICLALDMEKGEGLIVAKKYNVKNYPTFLWLDQAGAQVHRSVGSTGASEFLAVAGKAMDTQNNLKAMKSRYDAGNREPARLLSYARSLKDAYDMSYQTVADEYFKALPMMELLTGENWNAIREFTPNINSYVYRAITKMRQQFEERYSPDSVRALIDDLAFNSISFASQQKDSIMLMNAIARLKEGKDQELLKKGLGEELGYYKSNKNFQMYTELAHDYVGNYFLDDAKMLNAISWTYFQHVNEKDKLAEAEAWIARSVALEDQYYNTDTYANLLHKLGKNKEAIDMANHSIALAKKEGEDFSSTQDLLNELKKGR